MNRKHDTVGIDLGTTYSAIAYIDKDGVAKVAPRDRKSLVLPSAVYFDGDDVVVGEHALNQAHIFPKQVVQYAKRDLGASTRYAQGKSEESPESVMAIIVKKIVEYAEPQIGKIERAVVTVPAFFNERRRTATEQAGQMAGIEVVDTLNEPSAALVAYELHAAKEPKNYVVYDLGGGTFDVTIMKVGAGTVKELATNGARELGGYDWDKALVNYVADEFTKAKGADPREDSISFQTLVSDCRAAKETLSELKKTTIPCSHNGHSYPVPVTREKFEQLTKKLVTKSELTLLSCLRDANLKWDDIEDVILVGGSTEMPMIANMLRKVSGKGLLNSVDPHLAVVLGAARYAAALETTPALRDTFGAGASNAATPHDQPPTTGEEIDLVDPAGDPLADDDALVDDGEDALALRDVHLVNAHGVGVFVLDGETKINFVMIEKNSGLPTTATKKFQISKPGVKNLKLTISEGNSQRREACEVLGTCMLGPLPDGLQRGTPVNLELGYDKHGRVTLSASCMDVEVNTALAKTGNLDEKTVELEQQRIGELELS